MRRLSRHYAITLFALALCQSVNVQAQSLDITHCSNCGSVLLGAAKIEPGSIQYAGSIGLDNILLRSGAESFGFTGESQYIINEAEPNIWTFANEANFSIGSVQGFGAAPPVGFFFAPSRAGSVASNNQYSTQVFPSPASVRVFPVQGTGVEDSEISPALTLDVELLGASTQVPCSDGSPQCTAAETADRVTFSVTPRVNTLLLPPNVEPVQHAYIQLIVDENDTPCTVSNPSFRDRGLTPNSFVTSDYFHYLEIAGPNNAPLTCLRVYSFLVSINKTFQFEARSALDTADSFVDYHFSLRGHLDRNNSARWPGSQPRFRLSRDKNFPPVTNPPFANFTVSSIGPNTFDLNASTSTDFDGTITSYQWTSDDGAFIQRDISNPALAKVGFTNVTAAGTRTITLTVTDNDGAVSETTRLLSVVPGSSTSGFADFTPTPATGEAPLTVSLDCTSSMLGGGASSLASCGWQSSDGTAIPNGFMQTVQYNNPGTYEITLTMIDNLGVFFSTARTIIVLPSETQTPPVQTNPIPALGSLAEISSTGETAIQPGDGTGFRGGVKLTSTDQFISQSASLSGSQAIEIIGQLDPQGAHNGQTVEEVGVVLFTPLTGTPQFYMKTSLHPFTTFVPWNGQLSSLEPARSNILLGTEPLDITFFQGSLAGFVGNYQVFLGYRLASDGTLVFGEIPIEFDITP